MKRLDEPLETTCSWYSIDNHLFLEDWVMPCSVVDCLLGPGSVEGLEGRSVQIPGDGLGFRVFLGVSRVFRWLF